MIRLHVENLRSAVGDATNYAVAQRVGVRESTISRLLSGSTTPTLQTLVALSEAYEVSLDDLVDREAAA